MKTTRFPRAALALLGVSFRTAPGRTVTVFGLELMVTTSDLIMSVLLKLLVDAAVERNGGLAMMSAGLLTGTFLLLLAAAVAGFLLMVGLQERTGHAIDRKILDIASSLPGIEHHERPEYHDELMLLRDHREELAEGLNAVLRNVSFLVRVTGSIALLAYLHPLLLLLAAFALPSLAAGAKMQKVMLKAEQDVAASRRTAAHIYDLTTTTAPAKEIRLFGTASVLAGRHADLLRRNDAILLRARLRGTLWFTLGWLIFAVGYAAAILFVIMLAVSGSLTIGDVVLAMSLAGSVNSQVGNGVTMVQWLIQTMKTVSRYLWLVRYAEERRAEEPSQPVSVPQRVQHGIDLTDVSFAYPGTTDRVLSGVTLHIPAGSTVAIVGDNGAGKSTLVKLLSLFYRPSGGSIALDGIDITRFDVDEWRAALSAGFQDFERFELLAREVVGVGSLDLIDDDRAVAAALQRAFATDVVESLPGGLDAQLGKSFDDGRELSGGQWQKLALGRAMMRQAPLLLLLDEPTASLDAETEHALFERYAGAARAVAAQTGAITVFVSHRFSTVRMADLIAVVDGGRIVGFGSHETLMRERGLYAELYEMQARQYR